METQKYTGRGQLVKRLAAQVGSSAFANALLKKRGHMFPDGSLSPEGLKRNGMKAEERALDRDNDGRLRIYNQLTNRTTLA